MILDTFSEKGVSFIVFVFRDVVLFITCLFVSKHTWFVQGSQ